MPRSTMRVCPRPGCPTLVPGGGPCPTHSTEAERARGTRAERGYGPEHRKLRAKWAPRVATGTVVCWRCLTPIAKGEAWDLGHDDEDRNVYRGPEHAGRCNRASAARKGNASRSS
jgi:hypothetical protein